MNSAATIQIALRSTLMCEVLREALQHRGYEVLSYATSGKEIISKYKAQQPKVLIISNILEGMSGIDIAEQLNHKSSNYVFLSENAAEAQAVNNRIQVASHLPIQVRMSEFFYALQEAVSGRQYISPSIQQLLEQPESHLSMSNNSEFLQNLTARELDIMKELAHSYTTPQIAERLQISTATVNNHRANIMNKLNLKGRNQLMTLAIALRPFYSKAA